MAESTHRSGVESADPERDILDALRKGDEAAFLSLVHRHHDAMVRVASLYVPSRAVAEEVVQETWLAVVEGLDRFRGDSSLRTWLFSILTNRAKTRGQRERRSVPFSSLVDEESPGEPAVDPERFLGEGHPRAGHWASPPQRWDDLPEGRLLSRETLAHVQAAIGRLPARQRLVITLRDLHGWEAGEVRSALGLSAANQRVLLHRARSTVRRALELHLGSA